VRPSPSKPPTQMRFSTAGRLRAAGVRRRKSTSEENGPRRSRSATTRSAISSPHPRTNPSPMRSCRLPLRGAPDPAPVHVGEQGADAVPARVPPERVQRVEAHGLVVEEGDVELDRDSSAGATPTDRRGARTPPRATSESRTRRTPSPGRTPPGRWSRPPRWPPRRPGTPPSAPRAPPSSASGSWPAGGLGLSVGEARERLTHLRAPGPGR
jgi:hypothetical protein